MSREMDWIGFGIVEKFQSHEGCSACSVMGRSDFSLLLCLATVNVQRLTFSRHVVQNSQRLRGLLGSKDH